jgi:DNA sulfur modification protein DndC
MPADSTLEIRHSSFARPIQIDTSTPSCGHSRFGCWTCTVVERDEPSQTRRRRRLRQRSEGLLASGDEQMERLIIFRQTIFETYAQHLR